MSGLDNSQPVTDEASLHAKVIHHEHHEPDPDQTEGEASDSAENAAAESAADAGPAAG